MSARRTLALVLGLALVLSLQGVGQTVPKEIRSGRRNLRTSETTLPKGFLPAALRARQAGRYFVVMKSPSVADLAARRGTLTGSASRAAARAAARSQEAAIGQARSLGGKVAFRYRVLVNGFSAELSPQAAAVLARRPDVDRVEPVGIVRKAISTSVPFIGAPQVWDLGVRGQGMRVALVDTGIDYTHAAFGGAGTVAAYQANNPTVIEPGTFPTAKVIGGYDFVGENYDVLDDDPSNDTPVPDPDPLDEDGHGTHTGSTCCGFEVPGKIGRGVAPLAKLYAFKVWDEGSSTDDILVAAYERAVDPNQDGNTSDRADVLSFSGGVTYGTMNSVEAQSAQGVVDVGTVFVASAGNEGNQAVGGSAYVTGTPATARGVIGVAASIDEFLATTLTVNSPSGVTLPDNGLMVHQDWSGDLPSGGLTDDLFDGRAIDDASTDPADAMFCDALPAGSLTGQTVLVYKGSTGAGDCDGSLKAFNAQNAGATAVVFVSLFGGLPFGLGPGAFGDQITIPVVMISGADGAVLFDTLSPNYPSSFNDVVVNATLSAEPAPIAGFDDAMTDFTSEGPARLTSDMKPDISAPGFNITAAGVGTGTESADLSGTSMAAPHVSGVATLLRQLHPGWSPALIKAVLMNQAKRGMKNNDLTTPVPATAMGAGRVQAFESAKADSVAWPGSLSFGLKPLPVAQSEVQSFLVENRGRSSHKYRVTASDRYSDFDQAVTGLAVSLDGSSFGASRSFTLQAGRSRRVWFRLTVDPGPVSELEQEFGWYYFHPNMDGTVAVDVGGKPTDTLRVAWHVAPLATAANGVSESSLDLTGGPATMEMTEGPAAGRSYADLYLLGATDETDTQGEEDIVAVGARSFTGGAVDGTAEGVPSGTDELAGIGWLDFLTSSDTPSEPVEFGVQTYGVHNVTETLEVDVLVDAEPLGVFADHELMADYLVVKLAQRGGEVCVFDLRRPRPFEECAALYFPDYNNYNGNLIGVAVDAGAIGLSKNNRELAYRVEACTGTFSGDVPGFVCDSAGEIDNSTGTWDLTLNATDPSLAITPLVCQGFWDGGDCDSANPITVEQGSAGPGDNPSILVLFPNNAPSPTPVIVETTTG